MTTTMRTTTPAPTDHDGEPFDGSWQLAAAAGRWSLLGAVGVMSSGSTVDPPAAPGRSRPDPAGRRGAAPPGHLLMVANLKGGTGKSTVSVNLACALAERGRRTVVVDNDPQGTAASWAGRGRLPVACVHRPLGSFAQLEPWINGVQALRARHDVVLVDLPASMAPALGASLLMATVVLVPTSPSEIDLEAT
jgi:hypothetical protein